MHIFCVHTFTHICVGLFLCVYRQNVFPKPFGCIQTKKLYTHMCKSVYTKKCTPSPTLSNSRFISLMPIWRYHFSHNCPVGYGRFVGLCLDVLILDPLMGP
ncbi:unnamed protein product [Cuscuta epithymum]|uniref:Secreted protein n=1 Tax=Cuscuta epithymum TaxID=186058 RepID=A0AAV0CCF5_9ASTE|nr:unnamed protein product [Cuscuta epithymum]